MDKLSALNQLKSYAEADAIKFSEYSLINDAVLGNNVTVQDKKDAKKLLTELVDKKVISFEVFDSLKNAIYIAETPTAGPTTVSTPTYQSSGPQRVVIENDKPLKGALVGFLLSFFLNAIGLILAITLGDEKCKKAGIITFIVEVAIGVVLGIILGIAGAAIASTGGGIDYYLAIL